MRTTLKYLKVRLFSDIINTNYKHFFYRGEMSFKAFLIAFLPSKFINSDANTSIINTNTNKSSRLSNIFNRAMEKKKLESKFRQRFIYAFDQEAYKEMIENAKFFLRGYHPEQFELLVQEILMNDEELQDPIYLPISSNIRDHMLTQPEISLTLLIIWAFHIGCFDKIIEVISTTEHVTYELSHMKDLSQLLEKRNVKPVHALEYLNIATTFGINGGLAAIALNAHLENTSDINPLIYNEVANLYYYGFNVPKQDRVYAKQIYKLSAEQDFGPALWTIGILGDNAKYKLEKLHYARTYDNYQRSIKRDNYLSYNNIGKAYHRSMIYYLNNKNFDYVYDFFSIEDKNNILEVFHVIGQENIFAQMIKDFHLDQDIHQLNNFEDLLIFLSHIYNAESYLINTFFQPSYKAGYFYAKGSEIMIYENQLERYTTFYNKFNKNFNSTSLFKEINNHIKQATAAFAKYPCSESYYRYGLLIEEKGFSHYQSSYEYYYKAVFKVPLSGYRIHAIINLLRLHKSPYVQFKKDLPSIEDLLMNVFNHYQSDTLNPYTSLYDLLNLYRDEFKKMTLNDPTLEKLRNNLIVERHVHKEIEDQYNEMIKNLLCM